MTNKINELGATKTSANDEIDSGDAAVAVVVVGSNVLAAEPGTVGATLGDNVGTALGNTSRTAAAGTSGKRAPKAGAPGRARPTKVMGASSTTGVSKTETALRLLRRKTGASLAELQEATSWQVHSVRGFLSGTVKKKLALPLSSEVTKQGVRRYRIGADAKAV